MIGIVTVQQSNDWFGTKLPSGVSWGTTCIISNDGRAAMPYDFCEEDQAWLLSRGAMLCDELPADFVIPNEVI